MNDPRAIIWVVLVLSAPWALVLVVGFVRGYDVTVTFTRRSRRDDD